MIEKYGNVEFAVALLTDYHSVDIGSVDIWNNHSIGKECFLYHPTKYCQAIWLVSSRKALAGIDE